jgi:uncharacterized protein
VNVISAWVGLVAGIFGGLVGLGGGIVGIPLMVSQFKISHHKATATSLVAVVFTGLTGAFTYLFQGAVDVGAALLIIPTAIFASQFGVRIANQLPEWKLKRVFGWYLLLVALLLLSKQYIPHVHEPLTGWMRVPPLILAGLSGGLASGMLGVGGGTFNVVIMVLLAGFEQHKAQGTSLMAMIPTAAAGAWTHHRFGNLATEILPGLVVGVMAGAFLGGLVANRLPEFWLRLVFAAVLIWTASRYVGARSKAPQPALAHPKTSGSSPT